MANEKTIVLKNKNEIVQIESDESNITLRALDIKNTNDIKRVLSDVVQYVNIADIATKIEAKTEYIVQFPAKALSDIKNNSAYMNVNSKTGVMWPQLMKKGTDGKNHIAHNLPIKEEIIMNGNPIQDFAMAQHNLFMQQQINAISDQVARTYKVVERIEKGQLNDRIGLINSGKKQISYALNCSDPEIQKMEIAQGRSRILTGQQQIYSVLKNRLESFEPISNNSWVRIGKELIHEGYLEEKYKEYTDTQEYFSLYLYSTRLLSASYSLTGDNINAENVFIDGIESLKSINTNNVKSLENIINSNELFFNNYIDYMKTEKLLQLEDNKEVELITFKISGKELLEAYENE